jgi:hypothetical protein
MEDHPEPTETEDELASSDRHQEEEAMRGPEHEDPPRRGEEDDEA